MVTSFLNFDYSMSYRLIMGLTKEEKERLAIDLHNQGKSMCAIAEEVKISFKDIRVILNKAYKAQEEEQEASISSQAYKLFSKGKRQAEVAVALNLRELKVRKMYRVLEDKASL